ncbi:MAG: hypothetical protein LBL83_04370, partial [Clostridiales bacterium]|nr:hypothetical protein [Clostridiales bacterium]
MKKRIFTSMALVSGLIALLVSAAMCFIFYGRLSDYAWSETKKYAQAYGAAASADAAIAEVSAVRDRDLRFTVIGPGGDVLYDTAAPAETLPSHADRKEFAEAIALAEGKDRRISDTLRRETYYYAVRLRDGSVLRAGMTQDSIFAIFSGVLPVSAFFALAVCALGYVMAGRVASGIVKPLDLLGGGALESQQIVAAPYDELSPFVRTIKRQREYIACQLAELRRRTDTIDAIMDSMQEGLIIVNAYGVAVSANRSALRLLGAEAPMDGRSALDLLRDINLIKRMRAALAGERGEMDWARSGVTYRVYFSPAGGEANGAAAEDGNAVVGGMAGGKAISAAASGAGSNSSGTLPGAAGGAVAGGVASAGAANGAAVAAASPSGAGATGGASIGTGAGARGGGAIIIFMDITEKAEAERLRREFSANVSHELKTPLTSISGYAEIICGGLCASEGDARSFAGKIGDEAARLMSLVNDILIMSELDEMGAACGAAPRGDGGGGNPAGGGMSAYGLLEDVDVLAVAQEAAQSLAAKARDGGVSVSARRAGGPGEHSGPSGLSRSGDSGGRGGPDEHSGRGLSGSGDSAGPGRAGERSDSGSSGSGDSGGRGGPDEHSGSGFSGTGDSAGPGRAGERSGSGFSGSGDSAGPGRAGERSGPADSSDSSVSGDCDGSGNSGASDGSDASGGSGAEGAAAGAANPASPASADAAASRAVDAQACAASLASANASAGAGAGPSPSASAAGTAVRANRLMMFELLHNLVDNAIKYNRPGGEVEVRVAEAGGRVSVSVSDTGIGIPGEAQERVFERFYRVDKSRSRKTGGTGLGLAIVKHIAQAHGASVSLKSKLGEGTTVTVEFPAPPP